MGAGPEVWREGTGSGAEEGGKEKGRSCGVAVVTRSGMGSGGGGRGPLWGGCGGREGCRANGRRIGHTGAAIGGYGGERGNYGAAIGGRRAMGRLWGSYRGRRTIGVP